MAKFQVGSHSSAGIRSIDFALPPSDSVTRLCDRQCLGPNRCRISAITRRLKSEKDIARFHKWLLDIINTFNKKPDTALHSLTTIPEKLVEIENIYEKRRYFTRNDMSSASEDEETDEQGKEDEAVILAISEILMSPNKSLRDKALNLKGLHAIHFLTHLQMCLDWSKGNNTANIPLKLQHINKHLFREECLKAFRRLIKKSNELPSGLLIEEVTNLKNSAASGGHGIVHKGKWSDQDVAVKQPRFVNPQSQKEFLQEASLWRQLDHPNIVPFIGLFQGDTKAGFQCYSVVSSWMDNGTITEYLSKNRQVCHGTNLIKLLYDVACALEYLHSHTPSISHGDIKPDNVLIDGDKNARVGDLGITKLHYTIDRTKSTELSGCTLRYAAPEILKDTVSGATSQSDIWSFGMLMYEVMTGDKPYKDIFKDWALIHAIGDGITPPFPSSNPSHRGRGFNDEIWNLIQECWKPNPCDRAVIENIKERLYDIRERVTLGSKAHKETLNNIPFLLGESVIKSSEVTKCKKALNLRVILEPGYFTVRNTKYCSISIEGEKDSVKECRCQIEGLLIEFAGENVTAEIRVLKHLQGLIVGRHRRTIDRLMKSHEVNIKMPKRNSEIVKITGNPTKVRAAEEEIKTIISRNARRYRSLQVSPRVAEVLEQRRSELGFFFTLDHGKVVIRGDPVQLPSFQGKVRTIKEEIENERTASVVFNERLFPVASELIEEEVKRLYGSDSSCEILEKNEKLLSVKIRGQKQLIDSLTEAFGQVSCDHVVGLSVKMVYRQMLRAPEEKVKERLWEKFKVMVFFPGCVGYGRIPAPENFDRIYESSCEDIIKIMGDSNESCEGARMDLENLVKKKREEPKFVFPAWYSGLINTKKLDSICQTLSLSLRKGPGDAELDVGLSSLLHEEAELQTDGDEAGRWNIYRYKRITQRSHDTRTWRLYGGNAKLYDEAIPLVTKELEQAGERVRFGVLTLFAEQMPLVENGICTLMKTDGFEEEMVYKLPESTLKSASDYRLIIAGYRTDRVRIFIEKLLEKIST